MPKTQNIKKSDQCGKGWCQNHIFELAPRQKGTYIRKIHKVRMCPRFNKTFQKFKKSIPIFNKDHKFYTPCFILEEEQNFYTENDERCKASHFKKAQEKSSSQSEILIPKHGRKNKFCNVCRDDYEDYLEHIESVAHKQFVRNSKYTGLIKEISKKYRNQGLKIERAQTQMPSQAALEDSTQVVNQKQKNQPKQPHQQQQLQIIEKQSLLNDV